MSVTIRRQKAFSLMELLVTLVVMAILAAIILPKFTNQGLRSKESSLKSDLTLLRTAIQNYETDTALYPLLLSDLTATTAPTHGANQTTGASTALTATTWHGPYLQGTVPTDPVSGAAFTYSTASGTVGHVTSSATGNDTSGVAYSTY